MLTIISFILILALLVLVHEFGHFIAAKKNGVLVEEFGFGLPPRVWGKKIGETIYSINLLPIGGFVKVHGEEYYEGESKKSQFKKDRAFVYKKSWQKALILTAGIIGNFLLGWLLISFLFTQGVLTTTDKVIVEKVQENSPAQQMGIKAKDELVEVVTNSDPIKLKSTADLITVTKKYADKPIALRVNTNGTTRTITITPRKNPPKGQGSLGVVVTSLVEKKYPWYQAPFYGLVEAFNITRHIVTELLGTLFQLFTFHKPQVDVAGPVGIANYTGKAISYGFKAVLELIALLSLNLAVVNILPFPALDGGRLAFVLYEAITRKRVNQSVERNLNVAGMIILLSLAALITIYDIIKIYR
jgi:regulator of sigma E protease